MPRNRTRVVTGSVVVLLAIATGLTGCESQLFVSPGALRVTHDEVQLTVCGSFEAANLAVFLSEPGPFGKSRQVLDDQTVRKIQDTLIVLSDLTGWDGALLDASAPPGTALEVVLQGSGDASTFSSTFEAPEGGFPSDQWLRSDGDVSDQPC